MVVQVIFYGVNGASGNFLRGERWFGQFLMGMNGGSGNF